jgi:SAM-dependent methyltransferase
LASRYGYDMEGTPLRQRLLGQTLWLLPLRRADVDANVMYLPFRTGGRLLEVGCGSGAVLEILRDAGWQAEGVDFDPAAAATARRRGLTVHVGSLDAQNLPAGRFDAIVMRHVIEHIHDPRGLLRECRRLLRSDGTLALLTPNADGLGHRTFRSDAFYVDPPRHLHLFNPRNLRRMVEEAGFSVRCLETHSRRARDIWIHSREIGRTGRAKPRERPNTAARAGGLLFEVGQSVLRLVRPGSGDEIFLHAGAAAHRGGDEGSSGAR